MKLKLHQISADELIDTGGFLDKQDPSVKFTIGSVSKATVRLIIILISDYFVTV